MCADEHDHLLVPYLRPGGTSSEVNALSAKSDDVDDSDVEAVAGRAADA